MQDFAVVRFESAALGDATVQVSRLDGIERISQLFEFELHIVVANSAGIDPKELLSNPGCIVVLRATTADGQPEEERRIYGIVSHVTDRLTLHASHTEYVLTFVPRAWQSGLTCLNDIFMEMDVKQIIEKKLKDNCALEPGKDFEFRLMASYPKREFVVQYQETDLAFISRLAEDQGICFFFEHRDGKDVMVFSDANSGFRPAEPESAPLASRGAELSVYDLVADHRQVTTTYRTRDYNYRNPSVDVFGEAQSPALGSGVIEEYGIHAKTADEANALAKVRVEEEACHHHVFRGKAELAGFRAGSVVKIEGHPKGDLELILTEVRHHASQSVLGSGTSGDEKDYQNEFRAIPKKLTYRPPRVTPKPIVPGVVTGMVQSASDKEMGAIDEQGRYRVAFMYDSVTDREEAKASRSLRMAQPSAGPDRGFHLPLKAGVEVLVTCVNGDPDRPIIAGAVPNPQTGSPVTASNSEKSGMRTNKSEWFIDDREPRFKLCVDGETNVFQVGQPNAPEEGFALATTTNLTSTANGVITNFSSVATSFSEWKTSLQKKNILAFAGVPNPLEVWQKIEAVVKIAQGLMKGYAAVTESIRKFSEFKTAEAQKKAEKDFKDKKAELGKLMAPVIPREPVANPDGTTHPESDDEYNDRVTKMVLANPALAPLFQPALQAAATRAQEAKAAAEKNTKEWEDAAWDISGGTSKSIADAISAAGDAVAAGAKLISTISDMFQKVVQKAEFVEMAAFQRMALSADAPASTQRIKAELGSFGEHYNLQGATDSVGLYGRKNVFALGKDTATLNASGGPATVLGVSAHLKGTDDAEVAAGKRLFLTSGDVLNAFSKKSASLVAHASEQEMPGGHNMLVASEKHMKLISDTQLHCSAKSSVAFAAGDDSGAGLLAAPDNTFFGLLASGASKSAGKAKDTNGISIKDGDITAKAAESDWSVKKSITMNAKNAFMVKTGKSTQFDATGPFEAKTGKAMTLKASKDVTVKPGGNFVAKGSKVMLG